MGHHPLHRRPVEHLQPAVPGFEWGYDGSDPKSPTPNPPCEATSWDRLRELPARRSGGRHPTRRSRCRRARSSSRGPTRSASRPRSAAARLNRIAYRGRSDARARAETPGSFCSTRRRRPAPSWATRICRTSRRPRTRRPLTLQTDENGTTPTASGRINAGAGPYDSTKPDYAFFALDTDSIVRAFSAIVASTASGDYSTKRSRLGRRDRAGLDRPPAVDGLPDVARALPRVRAPPRDARPQVGRGGRAERSAAALAAHAEQARIYTGTPATGVLIPVDTTAANVAAMKGADRGDPNFTAQVVDWMRGYDGTLTNTVRFAKGASSLRFEGLAAPVRSSTRRRPSLEAPTSTSSSATSRTTARSRRRRGPAASRVGGLGRRIFHAFDFSDGTEISRSSRRTCSRTRSRSTRTTSRERLPATARPARSASWTNTSGASRTRSGSPTCTSGRATRRSAS